MVHLDQSIPLGLREIAIALICSEHQWILRVADNGIGVASHINLQNTDSLGMQLIYSLTEQLQGQVHYTYQAGSHFEIIFPRF